MSYQPFAPAYRRLCSRCGQMYQTDAPGARWLSPGGQPRYVHPGCQTPGKTWRPK